ncbi:M48 family metallopeptidase [Pseudooceanicola sp. LIPI14-2-Ac024]|uniref:M48 family metallopeptidase n=1 Tax=Pseudooceanicola sp. LIPI14-2-Ac024 TaxID=3344875 RepID=UPI0035CEDE64
MRGLASVAFAAALGLAGCTAPGPGLMSPGRPQDQAEIAAHRFVIVVKTVEPVAERECRRQSPRLNCDFLIAVDDRPGQPVNAFQSEDDTGRPVLIFTLALIGDVRNEDELAFIMSHEAAHHIRNHLALQNVNASIGARVLGDLATAAGASVNDVELASRVGASIGARRYSQQYELEADELGARIAEAAGFDAVAGALYFTRIPDPGDSFLGTHPPNAARMEIVRRAVGR